MPTERCSITRRRLPTLQSENEDFWRVTGDACGDEMQHIEPILCRGLFVLIVRHEPAADVDDSILLSAMSRARG